MNTFADLFKAAGLLVLLSIFPSCGPDLEHYFSGVDAAAFVLYDARNDEFIRYNEQRCRERFTPASTFKIPHSIIALETSVLEDENTVIEWDSVRVPRQEWWNREPFLHWTRSHTLATAIKYSVVWYYQETARRIGVRNMKSYLEKMAYGNEDISGGIDRFWLGSTLKISADEQVEFLRKFYNNLLGVSERTTNIVKDILVLEKTGSYTLSGKTGLSSRENGRFLGWFVGYVERDDGVFFFALNMEDRDLDLISGTRIPVARAILTDLGILPGTVETGR
ncbi:MAG: class D beta-lactamase [Chlorobi bacterium]|nr:class D beta-lactamase [Chlorobiota bacterium]